MYCYLKNTSRDIFHAGMNAEAAAGLLCSSLNSSKEYKTMFFFPPWIRFRSNFPFFNMSLILTKKTQGRNMKMRYIHFQQEVREMLENSQEGWMVPAPGPGALPAPPGSGRPEWLWMNWVKKLIESLIWAWVSGKSLPMQRSSVGLAPDLLQWS